MRRWQRLAVAAMLLAHPGHTVAMAEETVVTDAMRAGFAAWVEGFKQEAAQEGIDRGVIDRAFKGVTLNARVIELDGRQAEFVKPIWSYLDSAVSDKRIATGREKLAEHEGLMARIEAAYGVDRAIVLAIWGIESNYGGYYGTYSVIESLATLAYEGRRAKWARGQLMEALRILQSGDITPERMKGSWAGAMGHTQFIPTSFTAHAVDFTGDGRRDIWDDNPADALASAANYLAEARWRTGAPAMMEVVVPRSVDWGALDDKNKRPVAQWAAAGYRAADGRILRSEWGDAAVIAPAGARGPAFMIFDNFGVIRRYNNATAYALAVAHLADRIRGGDAFRGTWPREDRQLKREEIEAMQRGLTALGFSTGGVDGRVGPMTRGALRDWQRSVGVIADGYPAPALVDRIVAGGGAAPQIAPVPQAAPTMAPVEDTAPPRPAPSPVVMAVQERLNRLNFDAGPADGLFGPRTRAAIISFEGTYGLQIRGIADQQLIATLDAVLAAGN